MRWNIPWYDEIKKQNGFLLLPKKIGHQWRWLEYARWTQRYDGTKWINNNWIN